MFDKQLMKPLAGWITSEAKFERDFREEVFVTGRRNAEDFRAHILSK
jgi:hypothetical protein